MRFLRPTIFFLLSISFCNGLIAQLYNFNQIKISENNSGNIVYKIHQDDQGQLWLGTNHGVSKFDGQRVTRFTNQPVLDNNAVPVIYQDSKNNIWFGTSNKGICKYSGTQFYYYSKDNGLASDTIYAIAGDNNGNIYIATPVGVSMYDGNQFSDLIFEERKLGAVHDLVFRYVDSKLYMALHNGLYTYDGKTVSREENTLTGLKVDDIEKDSKQTMYYRTGDSVFTENGAGIQLQYVHAEPGEHLSRFVITGNDDLFVTIKGKGFIKNPGVTHQVFSRENGLFDTNIFDLLIDREGILWVASSTGLIMFNGNRLISYNAPSEQSAKKIIKYFGTAEKSGVAIAVDGSISAFDGEKFVPLPGGENINSSVWCAMISDSIMIVGTTNGAFNYNLNSNKISRPYTELENLVVHSICANDKGSIFFATDRGIYIRTGNNHKILDNHNGLPEKKTRVVFNDRKGTTWIGTMHGVYFIDGDSVINFSRQVNIKTGPITCFDESKDGKLVIGTSDFGAFIYNLNNTTTPVTQLTTQNDISSNTINCCYFDNSNALWLGSPLGADRVTLPGDNAGNTPVVEQYNQSTGFSAMECMSISSDMMGDVWFATSRGMRKLNKGTDARHSAQPVLTLQAIELYMQNYDWKKNGFTVNEHTGLPIEPVLNHKQNHLTFCYKAVYLTSPSNIVFQYMLDGVDDDWLPPTSRDIALYANISHGSYVFKVRASANGRDWTLPASFAFKIKPPWWQTPVAYIFYILAGAAMIYLLLRLGTKKLQNSTQILERKIEERTHELNKTNAELEQLSLVARETDNAVMIFDKDLNLQYANHGFENMSGYNAKEIIELKGPNLRSISNSENIQYHIDKCLTEHKSQIYESKLVHRNGKVLWTSSTMTPIFDAEKKLNKIVVIDTDISAPKKMEEQLKLNLEERNLLLREIHHRVKNNLQIIISLFNLQSYYVQDAYANKVLRDGQQRVKSMALIHEKFYQSEGLARIDFKEYIHRLSDNLGMTYKTDKEKMKINIESEDIALDIDTAVPCGLMLNELLANCFLHAFTYADQNPTIDISIKKIDDAIFELSVRDNGKGLPANFDITSSESLGMQLIQALCDQLEGTIDFQNDPGAHFTVRVKRAQHI